MGFNNYTTLLLNDGTVKTVGENQAGQCGTGNAITPQLSLYSIPDLNNVKQIACGSYHTVFLLKDGTVKTVGNNGDGQCGTGNKTNQFSLYTIPDLNNVKQIACGLLYTVFLLKDGTVKTVGQNVYGQCGTGKTISPQLTLYTIPDLNNVKQIACGSYHTVFLMNDGTVKTIGNNTNGQCGTGNTTSPQLTLYTIPGLNNVEYVYCGYNHTVFLMNDRTVKVIGSNNYGQCCTGNTTSPQLTLYTIPNLSGVKQISASDNTAFLLNDGTVKMVGANHYGQSGAGEGVPTLKTLYTISGLTNVKQIFCGTQHTVFVLNDETVKTIGRNNVGQCGTGSTSTAEYTLYTIPSVSNALWTSDNPLASIKYLILQNSKYYSINGAYYDTISKLYNALPILEGEIPTSLDIEQYGFNSMLNLISNTTINEETFKPINKFNDNFELKRYKQN